MTVTVAADAPTSGSAHAGHRSANQDDDDSSLDESDSASAVRIHNKMGGFKFIFLIILIVTALTSGFCFFRAVNIQMPIDMIRQLLFSAD